MDDGERAEWAMLKERLDFWPNLTVEPMPRSQVIEIEQPTIQIVTTHAKNPTYLLWASCALLIVVMVVFAAIGLPVGAYTVGGCALLGLAAVFRSA